MPIHLEIVTAERVDGGNGASYDAIQQAVCGSAFGVGLYLPADAYQKDVCYLMAHFTLPIASNLHNWRQTSHPVQSSVSIWAFPFLLPSPAGRHSIAGQPIFRQARQPVHFSVSTA